MMKHITAKNAIHIAHPTTPSCTACGSVTDNHAARGTLTKDPLLVTCRVCRANHELCHDLGGY